MNDKDGIIQAFKAINQLSNKINELNQRLEFYINTAHNDSTANIDYIALMSDIELSSDTESLQEEQNEGEENDEAQ